MAFNLPGQIGGFVQIGAAGAALGLSAAWLFWLAAGLQQRPPYLCLSIIFDGAWFYRSSPIALSDWVLARLEPRY